MPIFMDRHDVSESVTAEIVAQIHQEDIRIQQNYGCRGLTYWFDDARKTAFCLIEAPDKNAIAAMHDHAHGNVPHQIIEVDTTIVESFLGRIEDPEKAQDTTLNIINETAFRTIMMISIENHSFINATPHETLSDLQQVRKEVILILKSFNGNMVQQIGDGLLISFRTVSDAVFCALKIQDDYRNFRNQYQINYTELAIGLHAGIPVTEKKAIFEDTIILAQRMCFISITTIVVSKEVKKLFESENFKQSMDRPEIHVLTSGEDKFLNCLMAFTENKWQDAELKVEDFERNIGVSKSKLYRELIRLTGKSPQVFLLHFRLQKALQRLLNSTGNISEVAYECGFNTPSYFTKCFRNKYGIMPSSIVNL